MEKIMTEMPPNHALQLNGGGPSRLPSARVVDAVAESGNANGVPAFSHGLASQRAYPG